MRARSKFFVASFLAAILAPMAGLAETASAPPDPGPKELKCLAARAEPWPQGFVKMTIPGKDDQFIPEQRITKITSADGSDWTQRVLVQRQAVEGENLEICYSDAYPDLPDLQGHPKPERDWFPVLQAGTLFKLNPKEVRGETADAILAIDVGAMKNLTARTSLGGSVYVGADPDQTRLGAKARLRHWLSRSLSIDLAPGIIVGSTARDGSRYYSYPGFVGELSFSMGDWMMVTGQVETRTVSFLPNFGFSSTGRPNYYPAPEYDQVTSWSLGAKFGGAFSIPGVILSSLIVASLAHGTGQF